jgi:hypothetical protein
MRQVRREAAPPPIDLDEQLGELNLRKALGDEPRKLRHLFGKLVGGEAANDELAVFNPNGPNAPALGEHAVEALQP